jgi:hypothetical protein
MNVSRGRWALTTKEYQTDVLRSRGPHGSQVRRFMAYPRPLGGIVTSLLTLLSPPLATGTMAAAVSGPDSAIGLAARVPLA